jgi:hypothetical protein
MGDENVLTKGTQIWEYRKTSFHWKPEKNLWLQSEREICFEDIEAAISEGGLRAILDSTSHPGQVVLVVEVKNKIWAVPAEEKGSFVILWTAFPSRKLRKIYGVLG